MADLAQQRPRDSILHALKRRGGLLADEIAKDLGTSTSAVRPHLDELAAQGLISVEAVRGGPGRPRHRYSLTAKGHECFDRSYDELASCMMDGVLEIGGRKMLDRIFRRREADLVAHYAPRVRGLDFQARVEAVAEVLDECGYMVELEPEEDGYRLIEHNCPVSRLATKCTAACEAELRFIRQLADAEVVQVHTSPSGGGCCYTIRNRATAPRQT